MGESPLGIRVYYYAMASTILQQEWGKYSLAWPHPSESSEGCGILPAPISFSPPESGGEYFLMERVRYNKEHGRVHKTCTLQD